MNHLQRFAVLLGVLALASTVAPSAHASDHGETHESVSGSTTLRVQLGPRPFYLIDQMTPGPLKTRLEACRERPMRRTDFSIGHRGAALQFPEHTRESYEAAIRMGAGIVECDVTFTADRELVCRHSQCDLATTTNILATPLAAKCSEPFRPAEFDPQTGELIRPASARCCTTDITLAEFKTLKGKMDAFNPRARTVAEFMDATPRWRTDLYTGSGTLMTHAESIELFRKAGVKFTPELKMPSVEMPWQGEFTQSDYAKKLIDEYRAAGIPARDVFVQSFNLADIRYWVEHEPEFGSQAVYLDDRVYTDPGFMPSLADMERLKALGVNIIAPPMWALVTLDARGHIVPSEYARLARAADLDIITWTLERSGLLAQGGGWYYQSIRPAIHNDGNTYVLLDVLARQVGIRGIFSDWPATVTYYANCMRH